VEVLIERVRETLRGLRYPGFSRDLVATGVVRDVAVQDGRARVVLDLSRASASAAERVRREVRAALESLDGVRAVELSGPAGAGSPALPLVGAPPSPARQGALDDALLPGVRHVIAVASGKGGVGKSTVAVNLAVALAAEGVATGLVDVDVYGPSVPLMMGTTGERPRFAGERLQPFEKHGVRFMSLGALLPPDQAAIWRGPLVMKAVEQLLRDVAWGELDVLVADLPPGTGDVQLTLSQRIRLAGAVIVTTPQDVALADVLKAIAMFRKVQVPLLGIVENMSTFRCPHCGGETEIFGRGGGRAQAERLGIPFLGEIPLEPELRSSGDSGRPLAADPGSAPAEPLRRIARELLRALDRPPADAEPSAGLLGRFRDALRRPKP